MEKTGYLVLANGKVFKGKTFGATGTAVAEIVFATGMIGYLETLTDKNYYGQIVTQTFPSVGNYGVIPEDIGDKEVLLSGYICKEWCQEPSNYRSQGDIDTFFKERGIIGLCGIDTRTLTKILREEGVQNGCITDDLANVDMDAIKAYKIKDAVMRVSTREEYVVKAEDFGAKHTCDVVLIDYGMRGDECVNLCKRGCDVTVVPYNTPVARIKELSPSGILLSDGPGDPMDNLQAIAIVKELMGENIPMFGIGLGHCILAAANGFKTVKLKHGHHGSNLPAKFFEQGRVYITAQNHDFAVDTASIDAAKATLSFINWNDNTCEGIAYKNIPAFSVQFHPETLGGPQDLSDLYCRFVSMMKN